MYERLDYACRKTVRDLTNVLETKVDYEFLQAFVLIVAGFVALQFAIDQDMQHIVFSMFVGSIVGTMFFLSIVSFITFFCVMCAFVYNFTVARQPSFGPPSLSGRSRGLRIGMSVAISGIVTVMSFKLFCEGVKEIPVVGRQYVGLLYDGDDLDNKHTYHLE